MNLPRIVNESFFEPIPKHSIPLRKNFVSVHESFIWQWNAVFWKHVNLWEKTYGEHYERAIPGKLSESHRPEFIERSARRFFQFLTQLQRENQVPPVVYVLEEGPGTGQYAKMFLDLIKKWSDSSHPFYGRMTYILFDISKELLGNAQDQLSHHREHIKVEIAAPSPEDFLKRYGGKILFVRHGNLWDQLPCRLFSFSHDQISEILVQEVLDDTMVELAKEISQKGIEEVVTSYPLLWKSLVLSLKLRTKENRLANKEIQSLLPNEILQEIRQNTSSGGFIFSAGVLQDISFLSKLVDWKLHGYIEVVDIVIQNMSGFSRERLPRKFDGAVAVPVNGPLIRPFVAAQGRHVDFESIRGLNTIVTMRNNSLEAFLKTGKYVTMGEIAARREESGDTFMQDARALLDLGVDCVAFSDQAHGWEQFMPLEELLASGVFQKLNQAMTLPVFAARRKKREDMQRLIELLKRSGIQNLFVVTGDPSVSDEKFSRNGLLSSLDVLPELSRHFFVGAVAHPTRTDIPRTLEKIRAGAHFLIMQSTYDNEEWKKWAEAIKKEGIPNTIPLIVSLIPLVTPKTLSVLQQLDDIRMSKEVQETFHGMQEKEEFRTRGIELAQSMLKEYKEAGIFSGVYLYTRSPKVLSALLPKR